MQWPATARWWARYGLTVAWASMIGLVTLVLYGLAAVIALVASSIARAPGLFDVNMKLVDGKPTAL